jgi:hypothetical protein
MTASKVGERGEQDQKYRWFPQPHETGMSIGDGKENRPELISEGTNPIETQNRCLPVALQNKGRNAKASGNTASRYVDDFPLVHIRIQGKKHNIGLIRIQRRKCAVQH